MLRRAHGAEQERADDRHDAERGRGGRGGAHAGRLPAGEQVVPGRRPGGQRGQLPDRGQGAEEELAGPEGDDGEGQDDHEHALAPGAERRRADPPAEAVTAGAMAEVVEVVEVRVLAEGQADAAGEHRHLAAPGVVLGLAAAAQRPRWRPRVPGASAG